MNQLFKMEGSMSGADCTALDTRLDSQQRRTTAAEIMYGVAAMTAAILLLVTAL